MMKQSLKTNLLLLLFITISLVSQAITDTTYRYFFEYKTLPFQLNVRQFNDRYELSLESNKINIRIDSSNNGETVNMIIEGFESAPTTTAARTQALDMSFDQFKSSMLLLMVAQTNISGGINSHLLELYAKDQELGDALFATYQKVKDERLQVVIKQNADSLKGEKAREIQQINVAHQRTIDSILNIIDVIDEANRYGGQFEFTDKDSAGIPVYRAKIVGNNRDAYDTSIIKFYPTSVVIKTFNNYLDMIHVFGVVKVNNTLIPITFYSGEFSISMRSIYERKHYMAFRIPYAVDSTESRNKKNFVVPKSYKIVPYSTYLVNISDLLRINAYKNHFTFMVRNDTYLLSRNTQVVPYERRSFYDYLNFTTFLDFLGVVEKTPNSLIQIEGKIRLPLRLTNSQLLHKEYSYKYKDVYFPKVDAYLNAAFINGSEADSRFGTIFNHSTNTSELDTLYIDNFDLIRKNNIRTGIELGVFKTELKRNNLNLYFDYGIHFIRTNLQYTIVNTSSPDEIRQFNTWSWTHGPAARFEYRPDQNIGMDFSLVYNIKQRLLNSDNDNLRVFEVNGPLNNNIIRPTDPNPLDIISGHDRSNYKIEFNAYFMVNPARSNGGLYFRLSNYFSHDFKQLFPQVLVGYSTRLSGMVKNIRDRGSNE